VVKKVNPLVALATNLALDYLGMNERPRMGWPEVSEIPPIQKLQESEGCIIPILGAPETGKSVLARRIAEILDRPTYCVSPEEKPPPWIKRLDFDDIFDPSKVPPMSTLILDDVLLYADARSYTDPLVRQLERLVPVARHERKLILIFCSQTSALTDRHLFLGPCVFLKPPSLLFIDTERDGVRKLYQRAEEHFEGKSDRWLVRHTYCIAHTFESIVKVDMPNKRIPMLAAPTNQAV